MTAVKLRSVCGGVLHQYVVFDKQKNSCQIECFFIYQNSSSGPHAPFVFSRRLELTDDDGNFYVYTEVGFMRGGIWHATGEPWQKGVCIVQFNRSCPAGKAQVSLTDSTFAVVNAGDR